MRSTWKHLLFCVFSLGSTTTTTLCFRGIEELARAIFEKPKGKNRKVREREWDRERESGRGRQSHWNEKCFEAWNWKVRAMLSDCDQRVVSYICTHYIRYVCTYVLYVRGNLIWSNLMQMKPFGAHIYGLHSCGSLNFNQFLVRLCSGIGVSVYRRCDRKSQFSSGLAHITFNFQNA